MPRVSAEAQEAAGYRADATRPRAPSHLAIRVKRLWQEIVADRPPYWFRPGSLQVLEIFCELVIQERDLLRRLRGLEGEEHTKQLQLARQLSGTIGNHAKTLRISVQSDVERHSRKVEERGDGPRDTLIGGTARWGNVGSARSLKN
jgi:hypothetical protein